jgi:hypothetical protein
MKKIFTYAFAIIICMALGSCKKDRFEESASSLSGMQKLLSELYQAIPMEEFNVNDQYTTLATYSDGCDYAIKLSGFWDYDKICKINRFIELVDVALEKGSIDKETRDSMLGEALFVRAYCYFAMVRCYGAVPIVTEPTNKIGSRSTEKQTWDFVISELDNAAELLPEKRMYGSYRATKWAALGLQSRVALYAASVSKYWGKEAIPASYKAVADKLTYMESSYADAYYSKCIEACTKIMTSGRFSLYGGATTSVSKAKENLTNLFLDRQDCEFIFGNPGAYLTSGKAAEFDLLYSPNQAHSATAKGGWGNYSVTSDLVDLFDNYNASGGRADGAVKTRNDGQEGIYFSQVQNANSTFDKSASFIKYDHPQDPFLNKEARFQAWVLYPGTEFRGITIIAQGGIWIPGDEPPGFYQNNEYKYNGNDYYGLGAKDEDKISAFLQIDKTRPKNQAGYWNCCCGIRKFLHPAEAKDYSNAPWCDIRYAEILLNYAEAYAESGKGDATLAKNALNDIRHRAAFTDNIMPTLENVLHERRVEFAFEGHESYTLHRRREYLNTRSGKEYRKHTLLPVLDLRGGTPKYIFPRVNVFEGDAHLSPKGLDTGLLDYYAAIPGAGGKSLVVNPAQE